MRCVARTDEHHHGARLVDGGQLAVQQAPPQVPDLVACAAPPVCGPVARACMWGQERCGTTVSACSVVRRFWGLRQDIVLALG